MRITTEELRKATHSLLSHLEKSGHTTVDVDQDFYWSIAPEQRYDPYTEPKELSMGQLTDDWEEVLAVTRGDKAPVGYALVWLSSILRAVGEKHVG
jgi:hypothetical protein